MEEQKNLHVPIIYLNPLARQPLQPDDKKNRPITCQDSKPEKETIQSQPRLINQSISNADESTNNAAAKKEEFQNPPQNRLNIPLSQALSDAKIRPTCPEYEIFCGIEPK